MGAKHNDNNQPQIFPKELLYLSQLLSYSSSHFLRSPLFYFLIFIRYATTIIKKNPSYSWRMHQ